MVNRGFPLWLGYIPKVMLAVVISLMDEAYFKIAIWLNDKGKQVWVLVICLVGAYLIYLSIFAIFITST